MSLINEALKRAQQAQQENPPTTPPLEFQPVAQIQRQPQRTALLVVGLTIVIAAILGLSGLLIRVLKQSQQAPQLVAARTVVTPVEAPTPTPTPSPEPAANPIVTSEPIASPATNVDAQVTSTAAVPAPQPPVLKLQGIFFNPQNPSAVVSGKNVYLGDRVNGFQVIAISPVAVTLASATETNVLSLSE